MADSVSADGLHTCATSKQGVIRCEELPPGSAALAENDIVLDDDTLSRYHAVIVDTENTSVITDLRSASGVDVGSSGFAAARR
ncbi:FHA domain-containing protein [Mycobacterium sp. 852002-51971_SCH5477799-a]|uniref:FHA domain-containing protein n=1 Tax=Mycobacterium sp. 852002-51971_SCH5477799-a TaxID=1834106 RepID=UPI0008302846|nr:FHA domain-containing protein [Mycobacterium sp. 852002-51971_SCH5477799-a]